MLQALQYGEHLKTKNARTCRGGKTPAFSECIKGRRNSLAASRIWQLPDVPELRLKIAVGRKGPGLPRSRGFKRSHYSKRTAQNNGARLVILQSIILSGVS